MPSESVLAVFSAAFEGGFHFQVRPCSRLAAVALYVCNSLTTAPISLSGGHPSELSSFRGPPRANSLMSRLWPFARNRSYGHLICRGYVGHDEPPAAAFAPFF